MGIETTRPSDGIREFTFSLPDEGSDEISLFLRHFTPRDERHFKEEGLGGTDAMTGESMGRGLFHLLTTSSKKKIHEMEVQDWDEKQGKIVTVSMPNWEKMMLLCGIWRGLEIILTLQSGDEKEAIKVAADFKKHALMGISTEAKKKMSGAIS